MPLNQQDIKDLRGDLSPFLIHLTRNGTYKRWADIHGLLRDDFKTLEPKDSLISILKDKKIQARSPFGYFNYKVPQGANNPRSGVKRDWLKSVCFTETPVDHIYVQCESIYGRRLEFKPYGLAFFEETVIEKKGNPVMYFHSNNTGIRAALDGVATTQNCQSFADLMILYESFGPHLFQKRFSAPNIDFRWEREWRVRGDFSYASQGVAFGICPEEEIAAFEALVQNQFSFIDPRRPAGLIKKKLRKDARLKGLI